MSFTNYHTINYALNININVHRMEMKVFVTTMAAVRENQRLSSSLAHKLPAQRSNLHLACLIAAVNVL